MANSHHSMKKTDIDRSYTLAVGTEEMSDNHQRPDEAGGPPPTTLGQAGEVDGGNGPPSPQHQEDKIPNGDCQANSQLDGDNLVQPQATVEDELLDAHPNADCPPSSRKEENHTQGRPNQSHPNYPQRYLDDVEQQHDPKVEDQRAGQLVIYQALRTSFLTKTQEEGESALKYIQRKLSTFLVAYDQSPLPWDMFYTETTKGLRNKLLASELRGYTPQPIDNYTGYKEHLTGLLHTRKTGCLPGCMGNIEDDSDPVDPTDVGSQDKATIAPAQGETNETIEADLCPTCGQEGHLVPEGPSVPMGPIPNSDSKSNPEVVPIGPDTPTTYRIIEGKGEPHTSLMTQRVGLSFQGMTPEPSKHPKKRTSSTLGVSGEEDTKDPIHTTSNEDSEHEEALPTQIKNPRVGESPSDRDPTHDTEPQNKDDCVRPFLGV
jgi:hypothetical protein